MCRPVNDCFVDGYAAAASPAAIQLQAGQLSSSNGTLNPAAQQPPASAAAVQPAVAEECRQAMASTAGLQLEVLPQEPGSSGTLVRCMAPAAAAVETPASASPDTAMHDADGTAAVQTDTAGSAQLSQAQLTMLVRLPPDYADSPAAAAPSAEFVPSADQQVSLSNVTANEMSHELWIEVPGACHLSCSHGVQQ